MPSDSYGAVSGHDIAVIQLHDYRLAAFRHGDPRSTELMLALHRRPRPVTKLGLSLLRGPQLFARAVESIRPAPRHTRDRFIRLVAAAHEFLDGDVVSYAATTDREIDWAILVIQRSNDIVFLTARPEGHPAIPAQVDFLDDFATVRPSSLRSPQVVKHGVSDEWSMLALSDIAPPDRVPESRLDDVLPHLVAIRATGEHTVPARELADSFPSSHGGVPDSVLGLVEAAVLLSDEPVRLCRAHGDFVPWNMSLDGDVLALWDWTRAMRVAPWPFDAIHFCFQTRRFELHQAPEVALAGTREDLAGLADRLGIAPDGTGLRRAVALYAAYRYANEHRLELLGSDTKWLVEHAL